MAINYGSWGFRGVIGTVGAGLVPAQLRATTRVAPTNDVNPLNSPKASIVSWADALKINKTPLNVDGYQLYTNPVADIHSLELMHHPAFNRDAQ